MKENPERLAKSAEPAQAEFQAPSDAEFQVLSALWQHKEAVGLNEISETIRKRYAEVGMPAPAPTTISTYVRRLIDKGLVRSRSVGPAPKMRVGLLTPHFKQRASVYEATHQPSELMTGTFATLVEAYPADARDTGPLVDLIGVMQLPQDKADALRCVVKHQGDNASLLLKLADALSVSEEKQRQLRTILADTDAKPHSSSPRSPRK